MFEKQESQDKTTYTVFEKQEGQDTTTYTVFDKQEGQDTTTYTVFDKQEGQEDNSTHCVLEAEKRSCRDLTVLAVFEEQRLAYNMRAKNGGDT